jgi:hypothetical protein
MSEIATILNPGKYRIWDPPQADWNYEKMTLKIFHFHACQSSAKYHLD